MHWTITRKLFLALIVFSLVILVMSAVFGRLSFQRGFNDYLAAQEAPIVSRMVVELTDEFRPHQSWQQLGSQPRRWRELMRTVSAVNVRRRAPLGQRQQSGQRQPGGQRQRGGQRQPGGQPGAPGFRRAATDPLRLGNRMGLYDSTGQFVAGVMLEPESGDWSSIDILHEGSVVGELRLLPVAAPGSALDIQFARSQRRSLLEIAAILLVLAGVASWIIARGFTKPVYSLAAGTRAIANGKYDQPIAVSSNDELGALATDVNSLARVLAANREARRHWLADINHELRTPLTILAAELQSIEDGFRPLDKASVASLQSEVARLTVLVADLYSLSSSDEGSLEYRFSDFDVIDLLQERLDAIAVRVEEQGLELQVELPDQPIQIMADHTRISQLITNLLENAIRYTDAPGVIRVVCSVSGERVTFAIDDSKPGVPGELHQRIFERLYRVDASRNRRSGGSGLGLSLCAAIVAAHDGHISARSSALEGLGIDVTLPLAEDWKA